MPGTSKLRIRGYDVQPSTGQPTYAFRRCSLSRMSEIYARKEWDVERPEPEQVWRGALRRRGTPQGPQSRAALTYALVTQRGELAVYAASVDAELAAFVGRLVVAEGKLVDLTVEAYGKELWLGSIVEADGQSNP